MGQALFDRLFEELLGIEGGYSNRRDDSGGATRFGITESLARQYGYVGPMAELPLDEAKRIYLAHFWLGLRLDEVSKVAPAVAAELFDSGVNVGRGQAAKWLQRSLNVFNQLGAWWPELAVDGDIGKASLAALTSYMTRRGAQAETVMLRALNGLQAAHYIVLAETREKDEAFVFGWLLNRVR